MRRGLRRSSAPAFGAVLVVLVALAAPPEAPADPSPAVGLQHQTVVIPGGGPAHLLTVDLSAARVAVLDARDHGATALTVEQFQEKTGAAAVFNASFFDVDGTPMGLVVVDGEQRVPLRPVDWGVFAVRDGGARIVHTRDWKEDSSVKQAFQVGPRLVVDGEPVNLKRQTARRTAVCVLPDGRVHVAVTPGAVYAADLAGWLDGLGCEQALNLDGGPSTQLQLALGDDVVSVPGGWGVPIAVGVFADPPPPAEAPARKGCRR